MNKDNMKNIKTLLAVALLGMSSLTVAAQAPQDADSKYAADLVKAETSAPALKLKTIDGKKFDLSDLKGHYVVLDFWASWCPDCRREIPDVKRMVSAFEPRGVKFVGVSFDTDAQAWKRTVQKYGLTYTQVSELKKMRESVTAKTWGVNWIPSMVLVDPQGKVVLSTVLSYKMEKKLTELFPAPKAQCVSEDFTVQGAVGKLAATLQRPQLAEGAKCPLVVICHGFTDSKEAYHLRLIADSLANRGIASIRFDFNAHGKSEGKFENMTVPNEIEDAEHVVRYALQLPWVSEVALAGHSQGGVVAAMAAGEMGSDTIKAVALMAPAAVLREDVIRGNTQGAMYDPLDPPATVALPGRPNLKLGADFIRTAFKLPIYETAAKYQGPALIVHGNADRIVPYTYGERFHNIWKGSEYDYLDGFDHMFSQNQYRLAELVARFMAKAL